MTTLVKLKGLVKRKLQDTSSPAGSKKRWVKKTFILKPFDGGKDLFISTFGDFDPSYIGKSVEFDASKFNDTSYTVQGPIEETEFDVNSNAEQAIVEEDPKPQPKRARKSSTPKMEVEQVNFNKSSGVDWAAKDRAMAAGGILHDAAALVAPTVKSNADLKAVIKNVKDVAVKLVEVKRAVEEELK